MNTNPEILKRIMKTQTPDVLHSSGYAGVQNGGSFGAASAESFAQRRSVEEQRKFVRGYNNSKIIGAGLSAGPRPKTFAPPAPKPMAGPGAPPARAPMPPRH